MKSKKIVVQFRRKRDQKTNYKKRLKLLISEKPRLVIRKSLKNMIAQIAEYNAPGDKISVSASTKELKKLGWDINNANLPSCYLVGYLIGKKAVKNKISEAILDVGLQKGMKGGKIYSCLKGAIDGGLKIPHSEEVFPTQDRIEGKHINDQIAAKLKQIKEKIDKV